MDKIPAFLADKLILVVLQKKVIKKKQFILKKCSLVKHMKEANFNDLMLNISELKKLAPTILDVTHSVQKPNQTSGVTGGNPEYIESLARAGIVNGIDGIFFETHTDRSKAKSDSANMLDIDKVENLLVNLLSIREVTSKF